MNRVIQIEPGKNVSAAGDGAFIDVVAGVHVQHFHGAMRVEGFANTRVTSADGAELRPVAGAPKRERRPTWPSLVAVAAIVCALDHGNAGAAALVGMWWFFWTVSR